MEGDDIPPTFIRAFKHRFTVKSTPNQSLVVDFVKIIESCVSLEDNTNLLARISDVELDLAIWGIGALKAPGPDGLHAIFYHKFWDKTKPFLKTLVNDFLVDNASL